MYGSDVAMREPAPSGPIPAVGLAAGHPIPCLDGLRALGILVVMVSHSHLQNLVPGVFGVTLFFFISGFLITTLLMTEHARTGTIAVGAFYMRRLVRLYPPLIVYVVLSGLVWVAAGGRLDPLGVTAALAYLANYVAIFAPERMHGIGGQLWSLAVEEHFYLVFPGLLLVLLPRRSMLLPVLAGLCVLALGLRAFVALRHPGIAPDYTGMATECRIDAILFGALAALFRRAHPDDRWMRAVTHPVPVGASLAVLLATLLYRDGLFRETWRYTVQGIAFAAPVLALTSTERYPRVRALLDGRVLVAVGVLSYSLYLWHLTGLDLGDHAARTLGASVPVGVALGWIASVALAAASYAWVEKPFFALRRRFGSRVHGSSPTAHPGSLPAASPQPLPAGRRP